MSKIWLTDGCTKALKIINAAAKYGTCEIIRAKLENTNYKYTIALMQYRKSIYVIVAVSTHKNAPM